MTTKVRKYFDYAIKIIVFLITAAFLYYQFKNRIDIAELIIIFSEKTSEREFYISLVFVFFLMFINWSAEIFKWKYLTLLFSNSKTITCFKGVMSGITISMFLPNRTGDFAGRILWLERRYRWKGFAANMYASFSQVTATVVLGLFAIILLPNLANNILYFGNMNRTFQIIAVLFVIFIVVIFYLRLPLLFSIIKFPATKRWMFLHKHSGVFSEFQTIDLFKVLVISLYRFFVYCFQFVVLLKAFGIEFSMINGFVVVAFMFFVITVVPKFAITELATRGAIAVYILSNYLILQSPSLQPNQEGIYFLVSGIIWIVNLLIPAIVGLFYLPSYQIFKKE